ncbi:hypothetical protein [Pedobacter yonginense]|uniref:hypothetical protein n=1 Tax=Pedobacter yonginense TaxID=651869 RepID=UPI0014021DF1|nr:hypothetical protein [Pedobacter yonginense]
MSLYFQFPAIDDYPNLNHQSINETETDLNFKEEDQLSVEQIAELKNYLTFKQF